MSEKSTSPKQCHGDGRMLLFHAFIWITHAFLAFVAALCAVMLLAWITGRIVSDRYLWSQWLLWIPTPAVMLIGTIGWLTAWRPGRTRRHTRIRIASWSTALIGLGVYFCAIEHRFLRPARPVLNPETSLTIAHWNMSDMASPDSPQFGTALIELNADVTIVTNPRSSVFRDEVGEPLTTPEGGVLSISPFVLFSKLPIISASHLVNTQGKHITRIEIDATQQLGRPIVVFAVDMPSSPKLGRMKIAREVKRMLDQTCATQPDLVIGDFNMTRGSAALRTIFPNLRHAFEIAGHGYGASFHRQWPLYHIDHALIGDFVNHVRYQLIDPGIGRHRAQVAQLTMADSPNRN